MKHFEDMENDNGKNKNENELDDNECEKVHDLADKNVPVLNVILW